MATSCGLPSLLVRRTLNAVPAGACIHDTLNFRSLAEMAITWAASACAQVPWVPVADAPALQATSATSIAPARAIADQRDGRWVWLTGLSSCLVVSHAESSVGRLDPDRQLVRIVGEVAPPSLRRSPRHQFVADLHRLDRVVVESARPAHRDLPASGDQVAPEYRALRRLAGTPVGRDAEQHR